MTQAIASCAVTYHVSTDVGREREHNEDSHGEFLLEDGSLVLVVADGMGGHEGGEVASQIAVEAIGHIARHSPALDPREKLHNGFLVAHQRVVSQAEKTGKSGMGTTAVAVYVRSGEAYVAHVGDSRLYHLRNGAVSWMTSDHTRVQRMVSMGILSPSEAKNHPDANIVTRAIGHGVGADGTPLEPEVQTEPLLLQPGDVMVLCSDGVYDDVTDAEIMSIALEKSPEEATLALVALANERGGHDNITVAVLRYGERPAAIYGPTTTAKPMMPSPVVGSVAAVQATSFVPVATGRNGSVALGVGVALLVVAGIVSGLLWKRQPSSAVPSGVAGSPADLGSVLVRDLAVRDLATRDLAVRPADLLPPTVMKPSPAKSTVLTKTLPPPNGAGPAKASPSAKIAEPAKTPSAVKAPLPTKAAAPAKSATPASTAPSATKQPPRKEEK